MKRTVRKTVDAAIAFTIFAITLVELWDMSNITPDRPAVISDYGDYHLVYWYPLANNIKYLLFSLFFIFKAFRFNSCLYTKIVTILYLCNTVLSLAHIIFVFDYNLYFRLLTVLFNIAIVFIAATVFMRWLLKRYVRT